LAITFETEMLESSSNPLKLVLKPRIQKNFESPNLMDGSTTQK